MLYDLIDANGNTLRSGFKLQPTTPPLEPGQQWVPHVPAPKPSEVPEIVSRFQGRAALLQAGYLDDIEAYMLTADPFEREAWNSITEMRRSSPPSGVHPMKTDPMRWPADFPGKHDHEPEQL